MNKYFLSTIKQVVVLLIFALIAISYFHPILQGKKIYQSDIIQYSGMSRQMDEYRAEFNDEPYWIDSAFFGMPTYQLGANYPYDIIGQLDRMLRFLPRPADYLFLYLTCFYFLLFIVTNDIKVSLLGALAFGFSTYLILIIGAGHNSKAHAIAYMPLVLGGLHLIFNGRYILGFFVSTLALSLEINTNHFQMTYYLMIVVLIFGLVYLFYAIKRNELKCYLVKVALSFSGLILAIGLNSTNVLATREYVKDTTRGESELTIKPDGSIKENTKGLSKEYITQWSYGILESFNLLIPRFMGGASSDEFGNDSKTYKTLLNLGASSGQASKFLSRNFRTYWGDQPGVAGPAYIGATVIFLFLLSLFLVDGEIKWWLLLASILALLLSYGKNLNFLTDFFIDNVPLYNKFRAVSSIQVIVELCVPILAFLGLRKVMDDTVEISLKMKALKKSLMILGGIIIFFLLFKSAFFDFIGPYEEIGNNSNEYELILKSIVEDRKRIFEKDSMRSFIFILLIGGTIWFFIKGKLKKNLFITVLGLLILLDLATVDYKYVNESNFVPKRLLQNPFKKNSADVEILKDTSYYRVYDITSDFFSGRTSFFHNGIGGYHAAQPKRIQDLYEFYLANERNMNILNMLNVKYIISRETDNDFKAILNPLANGNSWFVKEVKIVENANQEIRVLDTLNTKDIAIVNKSDWENYVDKLGDGNKVKTYNENTFLKESTSVIDLTYYKPGNLKYKSINKNVGFAIFSENFYKPGWEVFIDGTQVDFTRVDYTLRGLLIPSGEHEIEFKFEPIVIHTGSIITLTSLIVLILVGVGYTIWKFLRNANQR